MLEGLRVINIFEKDLTYNRFIVVLEKDEEGWPRKFEINTKDKIPYNIIKKVEKDKIYFDNNTEIKISDYPDNINDITPEEYLDIKQKWVVIN